MSQSQKKLGAERLEDRLMLDGALKAYISGSTLYVTDPFNTNNEVAIFQSATTGQFVVVGGSGAGGGTSVAPTALIPSFRGLTGFATVGANTYATFNPNSVKSICVNLGGGNDQLYLGNIAGAANGLTTLGGADPVWAAFTGELGGLPVGVDAAAASGNMFLRDDLTIKMGWGDDVAVVDGVFVRDDLCIDTGGSFGNVATLDAALYGTGDAVNLFNGFVGDDLAIKSSGFGVDNVLVGADATVNLFGAALAATVQGVVVGDSACISTGWLNDNITVARSSFRNLELAPGQGADLVELNFVTVTKQVTFDLRPERNINEFVIGPNNFFGRVKYRW